MTADITQKLRQIFADAYHAAALQEADMQVLANALEPARRQLKESGDTLLARAALDAAVGGNEDLQAEASLLSLRATFIAWQKMLWTGEMENALKKSPEAAWTLFLHRYADALMFWRTQLAWWWADTALGESPENSRPWFATNTAELLRFQTSSRLMEQRRWPEVYPFLRELAENKHLTPKMQSHLWTVCASVQMYFNTLSDSRHDLDEAEKRFRDLDYLVVCNADYERVAGNYEHSRKILEAHLARHPKDAEALIAMGRSFVEQKNYEEAERWFDAAIAADPGNASAYRDKFSLWGKSKDLFEKEGAQIPDIAGRANLADPESALITFLEAAYTYQNAGDFAAAEQWVQKALDLEPKRPETLISFGSLHQAQQQYDKAETYYRQVFQLAPHATDGYWNMAGLCNERGQFLEAAAWYEKALPHCPMFARTLLVKAGEMYIAAGELEKARSSCLQSLENDPNFDYALNTLHDLADKLRNQGFDNKTGMEPALETLRAIRRIKGEVYEASFQNRMGNIYYYFADYQNAAQCYRRAIAVDSREPVYFDNLAGTLEKLAEKDVSAELLEEALQAAGSAARLKPDHDDYQRQVARIHRKYSSLHHFGVLPEERTADIAQVRVRFRDELYPWLVKDDALAPELLQGIEQLREKFRKAYGITVPGVRFSADWNISQDANFVIDLDGIPMQQGWLQFSSENPEQSIGTLLSTIEQHFQYGLADFAHYDSPEISAKFVGRPAAYAAGFFQVVRMLLKQKVAVSEINIIHERYEAGVRESKSLQIIVEEIRRHPSVKPALPVNISTDRALHYLSPEQEQSILENTGTSAGGQLLWQIRPDDPVFFDILHYLPRDEYSVGSAGPFTVAQNPAVATVLRDLHPVSFFSREEILNLSETKSPEIAQSPEK